MAVLTHITSIYCYRKILVILGVSPTSFLNMHKLAFIEHIQKPYEKLTRVDDEPFVSTCCVKPLAFRFCVIPKHSIHDLSIYIYCYHKINHSCRGNRPVPLSVWDKACSKRAYRNRVIFALKQVEVLQRRLNFCGGRGGLTVGPWTAFSIQNLDEGKRRNMLEIIMFRFHDKSWGCYEKNRELFLELRDQWLWFIPW